jgi:hypothetical protein
MRTAEPAITFSYAPAAIRAAHSIIFFDHESGSAAKTLLAPATISYRHFGVASQFYDALLAQDAASVDKLVVPSGFFG